jgi:hypothetical protein
MTGNENLNPTTPAATAKSAEKGLNRGKQTIDQATYLRIEEIEVAIVEKHVV